MKLVPAVLIRERKRRILRPYALISRSIPIISTRPAGLLLLFLVPWVRENSSCEGNITSVLALYRSLKFDLSDSIEVVDGLKFASGREGSTGFFEPVDSFVVWPKRILKPVQAMLEKASLASETNGHSRTNVRQE